MRHITTFQSTMDRTYDGDPIILQHYNTILWGGRWRRSRFRFPKVSLKFFSDNPSGRTVALGSTQPLKEMSTRFISWSKGGRCVRLTNLPPSRAVDMKSGNLNFLEPSGAIRTCNGTALPLP
jgi:hypothetical protein